MVLGYSTNDMLFGLKGEKPRSRIFFTLMAITPMLMHICLTTAVAAIQRGFALPECLLVIFVGLQGEMRDHLAFGRWDSYDRLQGECTLVM